MRRVWLILLLLMTAFPALGETPQFYSRGDQVADFTLTTWDEREITLYSVLQDKDTVLLHFFTGSCGGCEEEMPLLQSAYEAYGEKVELIAVTIADADTDKRLSTYCTRRGLSFPVARDSVDLARQYPVYGVPLTLVIDKTGVLREIKEGPLKDMDEFAALIMPYLNPEVASE